MSLAIRLAVHSKLRDVRLDGKHPVETAGQSIAAAVGPRDQAYSMEVGAQAFMDAAFDEPIDCRVVNIKGDLSFDEAQFHKDVDLAGLSSAAGQASTPRNGRTA